MRLLGLISTLAVCVCLGSGQSATAAEDLCYKFIECDVPIAPLQGWYPDGDKLSFETPLGPGDGGVSWTSTKFKTKVRWTREGQRIAVDANKVPLPGVADKTTEAQGRKHKKEELCVAFWVQAKDRQGDFFWARAGGLKDTNLPGKACTGPTKL
jgi:hypothetical protein